MRFDSCHPAIHFLYFVSVITATILFRHPVFLTVSLCCAFAYSLRLHGRRALALGAGVLLSAVFLSFWYAMYHHFGVTMLARTPIGNRITLEACLCGITIGLTTAAVLLWISCVHAVLSTDKIVYLFGRLSPRLSLFLSILLRMVPRICLQARKIHLAQQTIGRGIHQGSLLRRIKNRLRIFSIVVTWSMESLLTSSDSMRSRGNNLRGRTAFSVYRFDYRDRGLVIALFFFLTLMMTAFLLQQTSISFDPRIVMTPSTPLSYIFYASYACFCLLPLALQGFEELHFYVLRKKTAEQK